MVISVHSEKPVCEHMGICFITVNETRFSCGETYENTTKDEFPPELSSTWCINNNEVKKILMAIEWTSNLNKDIELFGGSILMILSLCFNAADSMAALHRYVRVHGGLISSEMTMESFAALEDNVENIAFDNNDISSVKSGYFNKYKNLRILSLSYNRITTIEMNSLPTASSLEML
ncbi:uncharacterized protein LOC134689919 [Mytilus trossulus]|uniref:uncharacterized protein LOC134689919 n=1 Tax=Mytilus trossulus TaxID=6551 RepID=UPI0030040B9E